MLDVLGFKGIWRRHAHAEVIGRLEELADMTAHQARSINDAATTSEGGFVELVQLAVLSDTFVFGVVTRPPAAVNKAKVWSDLSLQFDEESLAGEAVKTAAHLTAVLRRRALSSSPAFALRGAIAFGDFGMTERFIIGEAVDDAAQLHARAHGAFVALTASADALQQVQHWHARSPLTYYDVPLKRRGGVQLLHTRAVVPFGDQETDEHRERLFEQLQATFTSDDALLKHDVEEKKTNTLSLIRAAWQRRFGGGIGSDDAAGS
jgi:hypothetical protein